MERQSHWDEMLSFGASRWDEWIEPGERGAVAHIPLAPNPRWVATTRPSLVEHLRRTLGSDVAVLVIPGPLRYGQWNTLSASLKLERVAFFGDADPYDLLIYTSFQKVAGRKASSAKVSYVGLTDGMLKEFEQSSPGLFAKIASKLEAGERAIRKRMLEIPGLPPSSAKTIAALDAVLGNRKVELEAALCSGLIDEGVVRRVFCEGLNRVLMS
jgi:hypothetical protein